MNRPPVETALANLRLDVTMAASDWIGDVRGVDLEVALAYVDELHAQLRQQAADELTRMNEAMEIEAAVHAARHVALAERDEARQIARSVAGHVGYLRTAVLCRINFHDLPDWLAEQDPTA